MSDPLTQAGAVPNKASNYAPLHTNEFFSGLVTNRNPLRDPNTPYLYQKFYSATRYDAMIAGQNVEISPRLTPVRRPGWSRFNAQAFTEAIIDFYSFRVFDPTTNAESIRVIADSPTKVYDVTPASTKIGLFNKSAGAGQTSFQSVGNTLYMGNGIDLKKWVWAPSWNPTTTYNPDQIVIDPNTNLQMMVGGAITIVTNVSVSHLQVASGVLTVTMNPALTAPYLAAIVGQKVTFEGVTTLTELNGQTLTITGTNGNVTFTCTYNHADYAYAADTGSLFFSAESNTSGSVTPSWSMTPGVYTTDGNVIWQCKGPSVENWGIVAPTGPPTVANTPNTDTGTAWAASTYYWPSQTIIDSNNNIQMLTTPGTTANVVPTWALTGTTTDGTAVWTFQGTATRATSHAYSIGALISVTYYVYKTVKTRDPETGMFNYDTVQLGPYTSTFVCTVAGTSSSTATGLLSWPNGKGSTITDGTVTWQNSGTSITRTAAATSVTNISNSVAVTNVTQIVDSNGNFENIIGGGLSGAAHPTWATTLGATTIDNSQAIWSNAGPATAANTGAWQYGFAYKNSVTGHISTCSPISTPILLGATSYITVSGPGSTDPQVDTIEIYRTVQGTTAATSGGTLFFLIDIPAPLNGGAWSYADLTPDPPNPAAILNNLISADVTGVNAPPPAGMIALTYHLNRIWGAVTEFAYYSSAPNASIGVAAESFPGVNYFQMPDSLTKLWPCTLGLMFYSVKGLFLSPGVDSAGLPSQPVAFNDDLGLLSVNCFTVNGSTPIVFTGDKQLVSMDPSAGFSRVGFPIEDQLQNYSSSASYVTWYTNGPDQGLFICDGSGSWYRMMLTPSPESGGYTWSPKGTIARGLGCLKSIETTPGVQTLLMGTPPAGGYILERSTSGNTDDGTTFAADFTIGSLVLAPSGKCAELAWIATEALLIGSKITVSVLADEVSGTFNALTQSVSDPPYLAAPASLYSDRWYFSAYPLPAWMKHLQIKFAWPTEAAANELLTYTIYGTVHDEM